MIIFILNVHILQAAMDNKQNKIILDAKGKLFYLTKHTFHIIIASPLYKDQ